jgi:hypothetical protein
MELTPPSTPFENSFSESESSKEKDENKNAKKKTSLRIPLHASEVHGGDKRHNTRPEVPLFAVKKPFFEESGTAAPQAEVYDRSEAPVVVTAQEQAHGVEEPLRHPDLERVSDDLWQEFDTTHAAPPEFSYEEGKTSPAGEVVSHTAELNMPKPDFHSIIERADMDSFKERTAETADDWQPHAPIHLNGAVEASPGAHSMPQSNETVLPFPEATPFQSRTAETISAAPSTAGMAAEVAADEPDPNSLRMWEELNRMPPAETVPAWHPEASAPVEQPPTTDEKFQDIMQQAAMSPDFVAQTSRPSALEGLPPIAQSYEAPQEYSDDASYRQPSAPSQNWHPAAGNVSGMGAGAALAGHAAETVLPGGAIAHAGTHAAEGFVAGAAAGAVAGGITGHAVGRRENRQLRQELQQHDERYNALAAEQQQTVRTVEGLTQANQRLTPPTEQASSVPVAPKEAEQLAINQNERVEQSAFVNMVVDKRTGKLVQREGVNEFGAELQHEQQFEAAPPVPVDLTTQQNQQQIPPQQFQNTMPQYGTYQSNGYYPMTGGINPTLPSGQVDPSHELTEGQNAVNPQHLLSPPRNPIMTAITSPLLWLGVVVILLAYFAAAFL